LFVNSTGIILRETAYKDSSKILTVLTSSEGKITVSARGALRKNSKLAAVTQLLVFSEMTLLFNRGKWTLTEARTVEQFRGLREDIVLLALGSYFGEIVEAVADEDSPNPILLSLLLNSLFSLSENLKDPTFVKPAFELRIMAESGFAPLTNHCAVCGTENFETAYLDLVGGTLRCNACGRDGLNATAKLSAGSLDALKYIITCDYKKILSFTVGESALKELTRATEGYLLTQLERNFRTLDYFKSL
jgi:DNA repair protein RecO (recombination protein O)